MSNKRPSASPFIVGMYGYYAALKVKGGSSDLSRMFFGYSAGIGVETPLKPGKAGYWSLLF